MTDVVYITNKIIHGCLGLLFSRSIISIPHLLVDIDRVEHSNSVQVDILQVSAPMCYLPFLPSLTITGSSNSELKIQDATVPAPHRKLFVTEKQQSACQKLLARSVAVALRTSNSSFRRCGENVSSELYVF